ncbi:MAG TPA: uroporphyrinogen-III synthase [Chloroflexota bacterium]
MTVEIPAGTGSRPSMGGRVIALLEARRASELAQLVAAYGGVARSAPALREEPLDDHDAIAAFLDRLRARPADLVLFQTGVGTRALFRGVEALGRIDEWRAALERALVAVRGPKPTAALRELGVRIDARAEEPYTTAELLAALAPHELDGRLVVVQHYGEANRELVAALRGRGAEVLEVEVYRWALPEDTAPLEELLRDLPGGAVDALVVTSQVQVRHLFEVAARLGLAATLPEVLRGMLVAAVGPVAARALRERGVRVDLEPEHPKMGALVAALAGHFSPTERKGHA